MSLAVAPDYNMLEYPGEVPDWKGPTTNFTENFSAIYDSQSKVNSHYGLTEMWADHLQKRDDLIYELTGKRYGVYQTIPEFNKKYQQQLDEYAAVPSEGDPFSPALAALRENYRKAVEAEKEIAQLRKKYPQIKNRDDIFKDIQAERQLIEGKAADIGGRAGVSGIIGGFVGGMAGSMTTNSPFNLATLPIGGFGKTATKRIGTEALTQMAIAGVDQAFVASSYRSMDEELPLSQIGANIAFAGGAGAVFRGTIEGGGVVVNKLRERAKKNDATGKLAEDIVNAETPEARAAAMQQADPEAVAEINDIVNPVKSAEQRGAVQAAEIEEFVEKDNPFEKSEKLNPREEHAKMIAQVESAVENDQPLPDVKQSFSSITDDIYKRVPVETFDVDNLTVDAEAMQFKGGGDDQGVTERLKGTKEWSDYLAGVITVWKRADGAYVVADGHQRVGFAKRLIASEPGRKISIPAFVFSEQAGDSQAFVRAAAALRNIGEGSGSALDAAKVFRDMPARAKAVFDSLPPNSQIVKNGQSLAGLDNEAFSMVLNGVVDERIAAVVGRMETEAEKQRALMAVLAKEEPDTIYQAEQIVRQAQMAGFDSAVQDSLFGAETITESLFKDKAKVLERSMRMIKDDVKTFRNLLNKSDRISEAGNQLNNSANAAILGDANTILQTIEALAYRKGPVAELLTQAAREAKDNGRYKGAAERFVAALRGRLDEGGVSELFDGAEGDLSTVAAEVSGRIKSEGIAANVEDTASLFEQQPKAIDQQFNELKNARDVQETPAAKSSSREAGSEPESKPISASGASTQALDNGSQRLAVKPSSDFSTAKIAPETLTGGNEKLGIRDSSNNAILYHVVNNKARLIASAEKYRAPLAEWLQGQVSGIRGAEFVGSRVKELKDIDNKIVMLGRRADQVSDYLGARVQVDSIQAAREVQQKISQEAKVIEVDDFLENPRPGGAYRAIHMQVMTKDGFTYELQVIPRDLMAVYEKARKPYANWKDYRGKIPKDKEKAYIKDKQKGNKIFEDAWRKFQERDLIEKQVREFNIEDEVPISIEYDAMGNEVVRTAKLGDLMREVELDENLLENMTKCLL